MPFTDKERAQVHAEIDWMLACRGNGGHSNEPSRRRHFYERIDQDHATKGPSHGR
jgi:hypothetical protein